MKIKSLIKKLPKDIQTFINNQVEFIDISNVGAVAININWHKKRRDKFVIVYTKKLPKAMIIHEVAHAYLNHKPSKNWKKQEKDADNLAEKWGFKIDYKRDGDPIKWLVEHL